MLFLCLAPPVFAQDTRPVVAILPFEATDISANEKKTIEKLVQSYITEMGDLRIVTPTDREKALTEQEFAALLNDPSQNRSSGDSGALLAANYLLYGSIGTLGEDRVLTLEVVKVKNSEKKSVSSIHKTMSDLALGVRALVLRVFEKPETAQAGTEGKAKAENLKEETIVGTWHGDKGIELVRIFRGGKAVAVFSSGAQMELAYKLEGDEVHFKQISPNNPRYYHPVPYAVALELVKFARPMEWSFKLAEDGSALKGSKTATAISYEGNKIKDIKKEAKREAEWTKSSR